MNGISKIVRQSVEFVDAVLRGGPVDLPGELRIQHVRIDETTVKVPHYGGYEHFQRTDARNADGLVVFGWVSRTRVAE